MGEIEFSLRVVTHGLTEMYRYKIKNDTSESGENMLHFEGTNENFGQELRKEYFIFPTINQ